MVIGIGTDIVEIARLEQAFPNIGSRAFTPGEIAAANKLQRRSEYLAGRWAAKEAFAKALGCGFGKDCSWQDIEIINDAKGKPVMQISGKTLETLTAANGRNVHLSISHEKSYATAFVIIEG